MIAPLPARTTLARLLSALLLLTLVATACSSDDEPLGTAVDGGDSAGESAEEPADDEPADDADADADEPADDAGADAGAVTDLAADDDAGVVVTGELGSKPEIELPDGEPPAELVVFDVEEGEGEAVGEGEQVSVHYVGVSWTNDGEQFDASWDGGQPVSFSLSGLIPGWQEGIPGMKPGGRRLLVIPPELGYGASSPSPAIAENDTLVFVIDLIPPPEPIEPGTDTFGVEVEGALDEKPQITLPGGEPPAELVVVDLVEGDGEEVPAGATIDAHYVGVSWLNDGAEFDSSWDRGSTAQFGLNQVIAGWTEGLPGMKVGGRRLLIIPPEQGYGANPGSPDIAPNDTLVFVVDVQGVVG